MRGPARHLLVLEILLCFLPSALMLLMGILVLPMEIYLLGQDSVPWLGGVLLILAVVCGIVGLCSLVSVVSALFGGREKIERPGLVLAGVVTGAAPLLVQFVVGLFTDGTDWGMWFVLVVMPLVATAHILSLSRDMFIAGFQSDRRSKGLACDRP